MMINTLNVKLWIFRNRKPIFTVALLIAFLFVSLVLLIRINAKLEIQKEVDAIDNNYSRLYEMTIKPNGAKEINSILYEVDKIEGTREKLNAIANWESKNFTSYFWGATFQLDETGVFWTYDNGKIRAYSNISTIWCIPFTSFNIPFIISSEYHGDPYWIAYYKTGECEEKALLFAEVASRAGLVTRQVGNPGIHSWVEIKNNSKWMYFDLDCRHHQYHGDENYSAMWFNDTNNFHKNCGNFEGNPPVLVTKTNEDITKNYPI